MWNTENSRKVALAEGRYVEAGDSHSGKKLSSGMAMVLGAVLTIEIMIGGAMLLISISEEQMLLLLCLHSWYYTLQW